MRFKWIMFVGSLTCWLSAAQAQTTYSYFYVAGQPSYTNVTPGSPISIPIYFQEVNSDNSNNSLLVNENGLFGAGVSANFFSTSGGVNTTITGVSANSGTPTTGFDTILDQSTTSTTAGLLENLSFSDLSGVLPGAQTNGISEVYLGTLSLLASSTPDQTTTFTLGVYDPSNGNTVTFASGYDLDNNLDLSNPEGASDLYFSAAASNFSVTTSDAVAPEPASASLFLASGLLLIRRPRRIEPGETGHAQSLG